MFSRIRNRLHLTPSMAIAFVALVLALTGGAFAATPHGGGGATATAAKSKAKPKAKAGPRGPAGPAGKTGATGATGPAGATGPGGAAGAKGETGGAGVQGVQGETGATGPQGPIGDTGVQGPQGEPWTPNNTLPANATEKGTLERGRRPATDFGKATCVGVYIIPNCAGKPIAGAEVAYRRPGSNDGMPGRARKTRSCRKGNLLHLIQARTTPKETLDSHRSTSRTGTHLSKERVPSALSWSNPKGLGSPALAYGTWAVTAESATSHGRERTQRAENESQEEVNWSGCPGFGRGASSSRRSDGPGRRGRKL